MFKKVKIQIKLNLKIKNAKLILFECKYIKVENNKTETVNNIAKEIFFFEKKMLIHNGVIGSEVI